MNAAQRRWVWIGALLLLAALCVLPFLVKNYRVFQFNLVLVYAIAVLGLNILTGYNGQISLGHGAFYAIGAYAAAVLMERAGLPYWATLPIAGALCFALGFLMGFPALRLGGHYLALAAVVFCIGLFGVMTRRNTIGILLGIELMLNAVNINLVAFARFGGDVTGMVFTVFAICITVAEAALGLAIVILLFRIRRTVMADHLDLLKG